MQTLTIHEPYASRADTFRLWHLTDLHLGARACDEALLKRHVKQIADDPSARWIYGGDGIDCIARKGDKRYDEETLSKWLHGKNDTIGTQRDYLLDMLQPIAKQCIGMVEGNHERAALAYYDRNIYAEIVRGMAQAAGKEPHELALGVGGFIVWRFRRTAAQTSGSGWSMVIYTHHGAGGGSLKGGHALTLGRVLTRYDCDLALLGHRHVEVLISEETVHPSQRGGARLRSRMGMFVASYLRGFISPDADAMPIDTYPELKMLSPQSVGASPILVDPDARQFHVVLSAGGQGAGNRLPMMTAYAEAGGAA